VRGYPCSEARVAEGSVELITIRWLDPINGDTSIGDRTDDRVGRVGLYDSLVTALTSGSK